MRRLKNLPLFKKLKSSIQQQLWLNLFVRFGLIVAALLIFRVVFLFKNNIFFTKISFSDYLVGTWFDLITICLYYLPYLVISIMPLPEIMHKVRHWISTLIFSITTFVVYFFSAWDIAYFSYTRKRITYDYFKFMISDNTAEKVAGDFLAEFL